MAHSGKTMTFATDLLPQEDNIYSLGTDSLKWIIRGSLPLSDITGADDLKAIEAISGTTGLLKKTAANTWTLDTNTYLTSHQSLAAYAKLASPEFSGTPKAPTAANGTSTTQIATTAFVNNTLSYVNAMRFKGTLGTGGTVTALPASHEAGDTYRVITAGTWAGKYCEVGTLIICTTDGTAANDAHWTCVETNEDGAVIGPSSSTTNSLAFFNSTTGRVIDSTSKITVYNDVDITVQGATKKRNGIRLSGTCYGNTATDLTSNTVGVMRYEDGGVRIEFSADSSDNAALLYTNHDSANTGGGSSFHFVGQNGSNDTGGNLAVTAPDLVARRRMAIGSNFTNSSYALHVTGASLFKGNVNIQGNVIWLQNANANQGAAGSYPYITSLRLGDAQYVSLDEYKDDVLSVHGKGGLLLYPNATIAAYDNTKTYAVNDIVWHDRQYYYCKTAIETAEEWTSSHWTAFPVATGNVWVWGGINPIRNNAYNLGTSSYKWNTIYANTFYGTLSGNATSANYINLYETRQTTATLNKTANYVAAGAMFHLVASSSTSATDNGKTPTDANILQMNWDNNGGYDAQIAVSTSENRMYFRDQPSAKKAWQEVAHAQVGTSDIGSATQPVYMTSTGVITAGTALKNLAYKDSLTASDIPDLSWNKITSDKPTTLSGYGITNAVQYNGIDNDIGSSATAANSKAYWANNNKVPKGKVVFNYNSSGTEFTTLFSNNNNSYGSILRWGYQDKYIRILRAHPTQGTYDGWYTEDWEKISAGYADTAPWSGVSNKPTTLSGYGITDAKIASGTITLGSNTISPVTAINWDSTNKKLTRTINGTAADVVTAATLRTDLGLSNALHFIGITSTTLTDGSTTSTLTAKSTNSLSKTTGFVDGDVVMDGDQLREYVWSGSAWRLLGITTSTEYTQPASTATNTWIAQVSQGTDGKITATTGSLDTSGTWSGTASKATTTANTTDSIYPVGVKSGATTTLLHDTSITMKGNAITAVTYNSTAASLTSETSTTANTAKYATLTLGNNANVNTTTAHSEGQIVMYSAATQAHTIKGTSTTSAYTHTLPNNTGLLVSLSGGTAKGSSTKPVYIPNTGIVTECSTYAGGTKVTFNGADKGASTASFYAPTTSGTAGHVLIGAGTTTAPAWYGGTVMTGTAAADWKTAFNGTTDATASNAAAVTIAGGLGIAKSIIVGEIATVADDILSPRFTLTVNGTDKAYLQYNTTDDSIDFIFV